MLLALLSTTGLLVFPARRFSCLYNIHYAPRLIAEDFGKGMLRIHSWLCANFYIISGIREKLKCLVSITVSICSSVSRATEYVLTITYSFYRIQFKYLSSFSINVPTKYFRLNILLSVFIPLLSRDMFFRIQDREKKRGNYNSRRLNIYHCCFLFSLSLSIRFSRIDSRVERERCFTAALGMTEAVDLK